MESSPATHTLLCSDWEIRAWQAGATMFWRPWRGKDYEAWQSCGAELDCGLPVGEDDLGDPISYPCPFGAPGHVIEFKEKWCSPDKYIVGYAADSECGAWLGDGQGGKIWAHHGYIIEAPGYHETASKSKAGACRTWSLKKYGGKWRSPATMPAWAVRFRPVIENIECRPIQSITEEDARAMGYRSYFYESYDFEYDEQPPLLANARRDWDERWGEKAGMWPVNPWAWAVTVRRGC